MVHNLEIPAKVRRYEEQRESLRQDCRTKQALTQDYVNLDERSFDDLVKQLALYAKQVRFFEGSNTKESPDNWESFFREYYKDGAFDLGRLNEAMSKGAVSPHLSLMLAFLKLYQIQQGNFNNLLTRHMDFYYKDVLGFTPKKGYAGKTVVFPKLDKIYKNVYIPKGTLLDAGKGTNGKPVRYITSEDYVANHAKITSCMAYVNDENSLRGNGTRYGNYVANYGSPEIPSIDEDSIAAGKFCLAISSPKFVVPDGVMKFTFKSIPCEWIEGVEYTAEKGWSKAVIEHNESDNEESPCQFSIDMGTDPMIAFNKGIHGDGFDTVDPIVRLVLKDSGVVQSINHNTLANDIEVNVSGCQNVTIENKYGLVDNTPGAVLFGGNSGVSDYFTVKAPHNGNVTKSSCNILLDYYYDKESGHYSTERIYGSSITSYYSGNRYVYIIKNATLSLETQDNITNSQINDCEEDLRETNVWAYKKDNDIHYSLCHNYYNQQAAAKRMADSAINKATGGISDFVLSIPTLKSPIIIDYSLNIAYTEFCLFPITPFGIGQKINITPVEPETVIESAETNKESTNEQNPEMQDNASNEVSESSAITEENTDTTKGDQQNQNEDVHSDIEGTGTKKESSDQEKENQEYVEEKNSHDNFSPNIFDASYDTDFGENHILMGVEGIDTPCVVNIFFKINPYVQHALYEASWYYLSGDQWVKFKFSETAKVIKDTTHNMRQSGIVTLQLDENIFKPHTCLPEDKLWLKLNLKCTEKSPELGDRIGFDVNSIEEIRTQGIEAEYLPEDGVELDFSSRLKAGSISKLVTPIKGIKKLEQPYDGERGRNDETEEQFHSRVSEKLRHKGKAWNGSDYESMILENFPEIAAAKYIPCRNMKGKYAAGHVFILLAPDPLVEKQPEPRKPQITWNVLCDIYNEIKESATNFTQEEIHIKEPFYDELYVECGYTPNPGYYDPYYGKLISEELVRFIAPWSDNEHIVDFNRKLTPNDIVYFIESLPYVRTVDKIRMNIKLEHEKPVSFRGKQTEVKDIIIFECDNVSTNGKCQVKEKYYDLDMVIKPLNVTHVITSAAEHKIYIKQQSDDNNQQ